MVCFEPQRPLFQLFCANLALNNIGNVYAVHAAVGDSEETIEIPCSDYSQPWNYGSFSLDAGFNAELLFKGELWQEVVSLVKLDNQPTVQSLNSLKLLKIDAEGMEIKVLEGARKTIERFRPLVFVENNNKTLGDRLISLLRDDFKYRCYWHLSERYSSDNFNNQPKTFAGTDINMLCVPLEIDLNLPNLQPVQSFGDLGLGD